MKYFYICGTVLLVSLYIVLGYLVLSPKVSNEYYEYYISRQSDLSPREISLLQNVERGVQYNHFSTNIIGFKKGWGRPEATCRPMGGDDSSIIFKVDDINIFQGMIKLQMISNSEHNIVLLLNGSEIYSGLISQETMLEVAFGNTLLRNGINTLEFKIYSARQFENSSQRSMVVALKSFQIE